MKWRRKELSVSSIGCPGMASSMACELPKTSLITIHLMVNGGKTGFYMIFSSRSYFLKF